MKKMTQAAALTIALTTGLFSSVATAAQKIGVVDAQAIFQQIPQSVQMQNAIREEFKDQLNKVKSLEKDITYYQDKLQREAISLSETEKKKLTDQITGLRQDYAKMAKPLDDAMRKRQAEARNQIAGVIKQAIDDVAEKEKFDIVLTAGAVAYIGDDGDITAKVAELLSKPAK